MGFLETKLQGARRLSRFLNQRDRFARAHFGDRFATTARENRRTGGGNMMFLDWIAQS